MCERVCVRTHACMHMCALLDGAATLYFFKASHGCTSRRWQYEGAVDSTVITSMSWRAICHPGHWVNTVRSRPLAEKQFLWLLAVTCCSPVIPHNVLLVSSVRRRTVSWSDSRTFPFVNEYLADMLLWHYSRIIFVNLSHIARDQLDNEGMSISVFILLWYLRRAHPVVMGMPLVLLKVSWIRNDWRSKKFKDSVQGLSRWREQLEKISCWCQKCIELLFCAFPLLKRTILFPRTHAYISYQYN